MKRVYILLISLFTLILSTSLLAPTQAKAQLRVKPSGEVEVGKYPTNTGPALFVSSTDRAAFYAFGRYSFPYAASLKSEVTRPDGRVFVGQYLDEITFYVTGDGWLKANLGYWQPSDSIFKENCRAINSPLAGVLSLQGISFDYKDSATNATNARKEGGETPHQRRIGVFAQEVEQVFPELVRTDENGHKLVSYPDFAGVFIESFKSQQALIQVMSERIVALEERMDILESQIENQSESKSKPKSGTKTQSVGESSTAPENSTKAVLHHNKPNPFSENTQISFFIPESARDARILIMDLQGQLKKEYPILDRGASAIVVEANALKPGMFLYTLVVDQELVDTKKMLITQ